MLDAPAAAGLRFVPTYAPVHVTAYPRAADVLPVQVTGSGDEQCFLSDCVKQGIGKFHGVSGGHFNINQRWMPGNECQEPRLEYRDYCRRIRHGSFEHNALSICRISLYGISNRSEPRCDLLNPAPLYGRVGWALFCACILQSRHHPRIQSLQRPAARRGSCRQTASRIQRVGRRRCHRLHR